MRNILHYSEDSFRFHETVVARKRKTEVKETADRYKEDIRRSFSEYDNHFDNRTLASLTPLGIAGEDHDYLLELYDYSARRFRELKAKLTTINGKVFNICPQCTVDPISSFDHIIPKEEFVEFVDHPRNLIPCCSTCNSHKSIVWREGDNTLFLNLYIDPLPESEYLSVSTYCDGEVPILRYSVSNPGDIDDVLFNRIYNHYVKLKLCDRFSLQSAEHIGEINAEIRAFRNESDELVKNWLTNKGEELKLEYGNNYWKSILYLECGRNDCLYRYAKNR